MHLSRIREHSSTSLRSPLSFIWFSYSQILLLYVQYPEQPVCTSLLFTLLFISLSTLFFFFCTSYCFLHILLFFAHLIVLHILLFFAHLIVLHILFHCTFYSYFSFFAIYMLLCCVTLYNFYLYYFALSTERTWFDYISLLIIPCIIYYVTNKETLTLIFLWIYTHAHIQGCIEDETEDSRNNCRVIWGDKDYWLFLKQLFDTSKHIDGLCITRF